MAGGFYGADIAELKDLSRQMTRAAGNFRNKTQTLSAQINNADFWRGTDSEDFRAEWGSVHRPALLKAVRLLEEGSRTLRANALEQQRASTGSAGGGGAAAGGPAVVGGGTTSAKIVDGGIDVPWGGIFEALKTVSGVGVDGWNVFKAGREFHTSQAMADFISSKKIVDMAGGVRSISWADDMLEATSKFSKFSRFAGPLLAPIGIAGGIHDMINPEHSGWRGAGDRIAGGLSVISGGGALLMAAGALGPVGVGIVVGAGLVAGAWALGNYVVDNWDNITEFTSNVVGGAAELAGDAWEGAQDIAGNVVDGAQQVASEVTDFAGDVAEGAKDLITDPIGTIGGLFS